MNAPNPQSVERALVIRIGHLGDSILATAVLDPLLEAYGPGLSIDYATGPGASAEILRLDQRVNRVFPVVHRRYPWWLEDGKKALRTESQQRPYDLVINLECGKECDDFAKFVAHRKFCGRPFAEPRHELQRHCVDTEKTIYESLLGVESVRSAQPRLVIEEFEPLGRETESQPTIIFNPGFAGLGREGYRAYRAWPMEKWIELAENIRTETGWQVAVNGTTSEQAHLKPLLNLHGVRSLVGSSLEKLVSELRLARCLVSVDTGTMHLGAALGTPVVALFGPTIPALTGPYSLTSPVQVLSSGISCQPCDRTPALKRCKANRCMFELRPATVLAAVREIAGSGYIPQGFNRI